MPLNRTFPHRGVARIWLTGALALVAASGLAIGFFLPTSGSDTTPPAHPSTAGSADASAASSEDSRSDLIYRFPLSRDDLRDQHQAPRLATDGERRLWAVWESKTGDDERMLFLVRSRDNGLSFDEPRVVRREPIHRWDAMMRGKAVKRESRLWPGIAYANDTLYVSWVESRRDAGSQLTYVFAASTDGGETFSEPVAFSSTDAVRPTFASFTVAANGQAAAAWLDHRYDAQQPFAAVRGSEVSAEHLVFAGPDQRGVCPCCVIAVAWASDGSLLAAFRNNDRGYRDIWLSALRPGAAEFEPPVPLAADRWRFDGCPHDGPSLATHDDSLHVVWMDAHQGTERVYYARSQGREWRFEPTPLDAAAPGSQGHPALVAAADGTLHVVWDEGLDAEESNPSSGHDHAHHATSSGSGRTIRHAVSHDGGKTFQPSPPRAATPGAFQTRPALVLGGDGAVHIAWREISEQGAQIMIHTRPAAGSELLAEKHP